MKIQFLSILGYFLVGCAALSQASFLPATAVGLPAAVPPPTSYQFVARNWNRFYVPTATGVATYHPPATTYYKYNGGYPAVYPVGYPSTYPSGYPSAYPSAYPYGYGYNPYYGYKSVW
ncbi:uncharacterized protein LOC117588871 [Drosophila guanche]|uniref:Uncharacterized protein n=1 Tax=Drosophila guanche TaxID=7266 RepID=A0A3B0K4C9_DROGU|nr:uncharacterized protein LOC117588871 [Drosophila guanche]SPP87562.1 Hypothetical predicted protein [Drosophila guanche]